MARSEWICNACGTGFETKGKRDEHRQRVHRGETLTRVENLPVGKVVLSAHI